jgi:hypothetical protein
MTRCRRVLVTHSRVWIEMPRKRYFGRNLSYLFSCKGELCSLEQLHDTRNKERPAIPGGHFRLLPGHREQLVWQKESRRSYKEHRVWHSSSKSNDITLEYIILLFSKPRAFSSLQDQDILISLKNVDTKSKILSILDVLTHRHIEPFERWCGAEMPKPQYVSTWFYRMVTMSQKRPRSLWVATNLFVRKSASIVSSSHHCYSFLPV